MANIIHTYSQIFKLRVDESYKDMIYKIKVGNLTIEYDNGSGGSGDSGSAEDIKEIRIKAQQAFVDKNKDTIDQDIHNFRAGVDYIKYSRDNILADCKIHYNNDDFFETHKDCELIAFDSEGNKPVSLAQICVDMNNVYLFDLPQYFEKIKDILINPNIKKIICDVYAEQRVFNIFIKNAYDIQGNDRKSLVTCIHEVFDIKLKKPKSVHITGWKTPLSQKHIDYAAADVLWMYKLYKIYELK
jgi:hypothetical protein